MKEKLLLLITALSIVQYAQFDTIELVVVLFRHGDRTKDVTTFYPKDPYINLTYEPYGLGELTNEGKLRSLRLGQQLRIKYSSFLNPLYVPEDVSAISTNYNRTKDSLKSVMTGLFGNNGVNTASEFDFHILPVQNSSLKFPFDFCPRYRQIYDEYEHHGEGRKLKNKYISKFPYISSHTGINVTNLHDLNIIYASLRSDIEWKLKLPQWSSPLYMNYLRSATKDFYTNSVALPELNKLFGGVLLKNILNDLYMKTNTLTHRKLHVYSGHDLSIVGLLGSMEMYRPHIIPYCACILIELHKIRNNYYIKVLYQRRAQSGFKEMLVPGCDILCPLESFRKLVTRNIPGDNDNNCYTFKMTS